MIWVRSLAFSAFFYVWSLVMSLAMMPTLLFPRAVMASFIRVWGKGVVLGLRLLCDVRMEVRGSRYVPKDAALLAPKHQCMFDVFAQFMILPDACFVMKKELMWIPFLGAIARKLRMVVIDRQGHSTALRKLVKDVVDRFSEARQLVIFPEGTRGVPGQPGDYKPGIAALYRELNMPCTPVATNSGVHWPAHGFLRKPGTIVFQFLEPIPPGLKRAAFMAELKARVETASQALMDEGI